MEEKEIKAQEAENIEEKNEPKQEERQVEQQVEQQVEEDRHNIDIMAFRNRCAW